MLITNLFGEFSASIKYNELPKQVVHQVKRCLLDYASAALAGSKSLESRIIQKVLLQENVGIKKDCTAIGYEEKMSCLDAALINATSSHAFDMDDGYSLAMAHPATTVISASLAAAERHKVTGASLIEGIVVGYEIFCRIGATIQPEFRKKGLHFTGTGGTLGAALATSKIIGLNAQATANAISLAATQAPISLLEYLIDGTMMKNLSPGRASSNGVFAALLAQEGFTGSLSAFEGDKGFLQVFSKNYSLEFIKKQLGEHYSILDIYFKPYPSCRYTHVPINLALNLTKKYNINFKDIESIECHTFAAAVDGHEDNCPKTIIAASQSIPYSIAISIINKKVGINEYLNNINNPEVLNLSKKVKLIHEPKMENRYPRWRPAKIVIHTVQGNVYSSLSESTHGDPELPLSDEEIINKFIDSAKYVGNCQYNRIVEKICNIEKIEDISQVMSSFSTENHDKR